MSMRMWRWNQRNTGTKHENQDLSEYNAKFRSHKTKIDNFKSIEKYSTWQNKVKNINILGEIFSILTNQELISLVEKVFIQIIRKGW
jgi:hypothetical protein